MKIDRVILLAVAIAFTVAGCSSAPPAEEKPAPAPEAKPAPPPPPPPPPAPQPVQAPPPVPMDPLNDPNSLLHKSIFFDFDKSLIHDSDVRILEADGNYMLDHIARKVRIEGNCDERGSREYNLALGQRRAEAARQRLKLMGVSVDRIDAISLGKEKPRNPGHDEAAWAENRRDDFFFK